MNVYVQLAPDGSGHCVRYEVPSLHTSSFHMYRPWKCKLMPLEVDGRLFGRLLISVICSHI